MEWMGITAMRINNIGYLLKEGIKSIFTHGFMSFAAVCVTVACLLIVGSFSILSYNVNIMVEDLNQLHAESVAGTFPDRETSFNKVVEIPKLY